MKYMSEKNLLVSIIEYEKIDSRETATSEPGNGKRVCFDINIKPEKSK